MALCQSRCDVVPNTTAASLDRVVDIDVTANHVAPTDATSAFSDLAVAAGASLLHTCTDIEYILINRQFPAIWPNTTEKGQKHS